MAEVSIDQQEVGHLAEKLDSLGQDLSDDEKTLLLAVFKLAAEGISGDVRDDVAGVIRGDREGSLVVEREGPLPSLSSGFREAFAPGVSGEDFTAGVKWEASVKVSGG